MIGERFVSTGITVRYGYAGSRSTATGTVERFGWQATCRFMDAGFANDDPGAGAISTEGVIHTRYFVGNLTGDETGPMAVEAHGNALAAAIDAVRRDAEAMGIQFGIEGTGPWIYGHGDGEDPASNLPYGWKALLRTQADRLGWKDAYPERQA